MNPIMAHPQQVLQANMHRQAQQDAFHPDFAAGDDAKAVEYTISQDRSAGLSAQVEEGYALLARQGMPPGSAAAPSNGALQDYQMQLMLLEQQNKKRMMMARQAQDLNRPVPSIDDQDLDTQAAASDMKSAADTHENTTIPKVLDADETSHEPEDPIREFYRVVYRVSCPAGRPQCNRKAYQDEPRPVQICIGQEGHRSSFMEDHVAGAQPIKDLRAFLSNAPRAAFIVYRDIQCHAASASPTSVLGINSRQDKSSACHETISVVSEDLQSVLQKTSLFAPDRGAYKMPIPYQQHTPGQPVDPREALGPWSASPSEYTHRFLFQHRQVLRDEALRCGDKAGEPLDTLLFYLCNNPNPMYAKCDALFSRGVVTKDTLEWLYCPNELLVSNEGSVQTCHVLRCFPSVDGATLNLYCWNWGYDGHRVRRKSQDLSVQIPSFGETRIDQLAAYPLRFASQEVRDKLLANGHKSWRHRGQMQIAYQGPDYQGERTYPQGSRFMVDYQVYRKFHGASAAFLFSTTQRAPFDPWRDEIPCDGDDAVLNDSEMFLLPAGIHGFYFKEKKWVHLLVDNIQPIEWNKMAYEQLVLPARTKNLVKALVMVRKEARAASEEHLQAGLAEILKKDDLIAGKGNGLIMLLHGGPGTGKTLTAGDVAELAEMPLYSVTCGDIGTKPEAVEKYLNTVLYLGKKWNCVLLLDEADVFLEQRSLSDLDRNSLVSVFLRTLEYYDGVLILTSNRVSTFDEAFKSRIQLALHYQALDNPGRRKIWTNFLDMLQDPAHSPSSNSSSSSAKNRWSEKVNVADIHAHMDELAAYELNGRQIRNALTTARQLSLFEESVLDWEGLKGAIEVAVGFSRYLGDGGEEHLHLGESESERGIVSGRGYRDARETEGETESTISASGSWVSTGTFR